MHPTRDPTHNVGMWPDQKWNPQPSGVLDDTPNKTEKPEREID